MKRLIAALSFLVLSVGALSGQSFSAFDREIQVHGFASQGFAYSNDNNYLTMKTSEGSGAFSDAGVNVSTSITDKLRVGAQMYMRNVGNLGNWQPTLDWAVADYKFAEWFGIRAGKVKTTLGLFNDSQDMQFLHTWAILPQSAYPLDLRASTIAHLGGDIYGTISVPKAGSVSYTVYAGSRPDDEEGGYRYGLTAAGIETSSNPGDQIGGDLRWRTPLKGVMVGASFLNAPTGATASRRITPQLSLPISIDAHDRTTVLYAEYSVKKLTFNGEYRRELLGGTQQVGSMPRTRFRQDQRGWWASAAYRVSKKLELGTYHSRFYPNWPTPFRGAANNHLFDQVATARIDLNTHWDLKVEGHFVDGYGSPFSFRGFYPQDNPDGMKSSMRMLVLRTGFNF